MLICCNNYKKCILEMINHFTIYKYFKISDNVCVMLIIPMILTKLFAKNYFWKFIYIKVVFIQICVKTK